MSKQDVLDAIRNHYRLLEQFDPNVEKGANLTFDTWVDDWCSASDLPLGEKLGSTLNARFDVEISREEWRATLEPRTATLGSVCELLASRAEMPDIKPFSVCGTECLSAGAFLAVRTALEREGVPVEGLRPSAPIEPLARAHLGSFVTALGKIAPNALPAPEVTYKFAQRMGVWLLMGGVISLLAAALAATPKLAHLGISPTLAWLGLVSILVSFLMFYLVRADPFKTLSFSAVKTFRDLTQVVIRRT
jgi:hypothetical protein